MKSSIKIYVIALVMLVVTNTNIKANGLVLGAAAVNLAGTGNQLTFTILWNNSWMTAAPNNWDGVWIFAKYQDCTTPTVWSPVIFSTGAGHSITNAGGNSLIVVPVADGMGVFIRRNAIGGPGNITVETVTLTMTTPAGGGPAYNFKVFGIEMVRITPETFQIGDNATSASSFTNTDVTLAVQTGGILAGALYAGSPAVPSTFPMRTDIYCMKYEVTNEQYCDFLNCLDYTQQQTRTVQWPNVAAGIYVMYAGTNRNRTSIVISSSGVASTTPATYACNLNNNGVYNAADDGLAIPCAFLSWGDLTAYLDWSGLRPMTDIEFERICRGPIGRVSGEYVWGTLVASQAGPNSCVGVSNSGTVSEVPTAGNVGYNCGSCNTDNTSDAGPLRAGSLAAFAPTRTGCGASYYGVMEMAGSVWERVVAISAAATFTGVLGNGTIDANGNADVASWPSATTAVGSGRRGGGWTNSGGSINYLRTSDRQFALTTDATRTCAYGGRGVR